MHYKLGSQIDTFNPDLFEWSLCLESKSRLITYVPLGSYPSGHPVVVAARNLVKLLNGEK